MNAEQKKRVTGSFLLLAGLLLLLMAASAGIGSVNVSPGELLSSDIVWKIRLPRMAAAAVLGGALSLSGFLLQTFFSNPIAGPFVLGISSGAKFVVALLMIACLSYRIAVTRMLMVAAAFCGALLSVAFILVISNRVSDMSVLVICGIMIGYITSAVTDLLVTFADESNIVNLHNWSKGSFSGADWGDMAVYLPITLFGLFCCAFLAKPMGAYRQGADYAKSLGVNLPRFRMALILISSLLAACVTAFCGPISFLGVAVPHLMRKLFSASDPILLIPACFLGGSVFTLFCDLLARTLFAPTELGISTVTAIFGAPVVIGMMIKRRETP